MKRRINNHIIGHENIKIHRMLHISDTHCHHNGLELQLDNVETIMHTGDATNSRAPTINLMEWEKFIEWYASLPVKNKIYVPGNHDAACHHYRSFIKDSCAAADVHYLDKTAVEINGIVFYGDPTTPTFGSWYFMAERHKINRHWKMIPEETQVLLTHGPRKGFLDLTDHGYVGDKSLGKRIDALPNLLLHCFGHIHDHFEIKNNGILIRDGITYSNAACVEDGLISEGIKNHGNYLVI